jgi:hypothetical protein
MKLQKNENGTYLLYGDEGFSGASLSFNINDTCVIFYSGTAEYDEDKAIRDIKNYIESKGGKFISNGNSTKTQFWTKWIIPTKLTELVQEK